MWSELKHGSENEKKLIKRSTKSSFTHLSTGTLFHNAGLSEKTIFNHLDQNFN